MQFLNMKFLSTVPQNLVASFLALALSCGTFVSPIVGQTANQPPAAPTIAELAGKMDKFLSDAVETKGWSGALLVVKNGTVLLERGYGYADCARTRKIEPDMVFDIGSLTKYITRAAILKLQAQGKLKIDDPISRHLDGVPEDKAAITILQLMLHTSGLQDVFGDDEVYVTRDWLVKSALTSKLLFEPGKPNTEDPYSNAGYALLGAIIEKLSGKSYEAYVNENLFKPAGLRQTGYFMPKWKKEKVACGFRDNKPWGSVRDFYGKTEPSWNLIAAGGMLSTVVELNQLFTALLQGKVLPKAETDLFFSNVRKNSLGRRVMSPSGSNNIFSSLYVNYIDDGLSLVFFSSDSRHNVENGFPRPLFPDFNKLLPTAN